MAETDDEVIYRHRWWALAVLSLSLLIVGLDNTILNVALPHLSESLEASNSQLQWMVDSYVLVFAGLILTAGSLGDRFGRKGALSVGLVLFGIGSAVSAFASDASMLIGTRAFMGVGGALIMPATLSILTNIFRDPAERARAIGVWAGIAAAGIALGPVVGGLLLAHFWWGAVFLVNIPVVVMALVAGNRLLPSSKDPSKPRLDPIGAVLSIAALVTLLWGIIEAPANGWTSRPIITAFVAGLVLLGAFIAWEFHSEHPMLEVRFFSNARFSAANAGITLVFFALFGSSFLLTQQLQFVLGYSALKAGFALTPIAGPLLILGPLSARLVERFGTKIVVSTGLLLAAIGLFWLSTLAYGDGYTAVLFPMIVLASGMGLTMAPATESIMGSIPREKAGIGSAMNDATRQVGGALGVAVIGSVLASVYRPNVVDKLNQTALGELAAGRSALAAQAQQGIEAIRDQLGAAYAVADRLPGGASSSQGAEIIDAAKHAFVDGFGGAVMVGALVALFGAVVVFIFLPARGADPEDHTAASEPETPDNRLDTEADEVVGAADDQLTTNGADPDSAVGSTATRGSTADGTGAK